MSKIARGTIDRAGKKSLGKRGTRYWFQIGDEFYSTFDSKIVRGWKEGMDVVIEYEEKGDYKNIIAMHSPEDWQKKQAQPSTPTLKIEALRQAVRFLTPWPEGINDVSQAIKAAVKAAHYFEKYLLGEFNVKQDKTSSNRQQIENKLLEALAEAELSQEAFLAWVSDKFETKLQSLDAVPIGTLVEVLENFEKYKDKIAEYEESPF